MFFFFKQKTAYELRISDWSSDVCSSDLADHVGVVFEFRQAVFHHLRLVRAKHAILPRMHRQADFVGPCQFADRGEASLEAVPYLGATVERRDLGDRTSGV